MTNAAFDCSKLPEIYRPGFELLAETVWRTAGENLLGLAAFGGWLGDDPLFNDTPGRGVIVLREIDLTMLDRLAGDAVKFGRANLAAPLMMTPGYIESSRDVFPLEFLEIRQTRVVVYGRDVFADLEFKPADVRLQCERELKGELVQLRQGLLAAAGKHQHLNGLCRHVAARIIRYLRGVLLLGGVTDPPRVSSGIVRKAGESIGVKLETLAAVAAATATVDFAIFQRLYGEIDALSQAVDGLSVTG